MDPITREEMYLAAASGQAVEVPEPITRQEMFLKALVDIVAAGGASPEAIKEAVNAYLDKNPVAGGATAEQAAQIEQNKSDIAALQTDVDDLKEQGGGIMQPLTLTGAVSATYDGSKAVSVEIPSGGGGGVAITEEIITGVVTATITVPQNCLALISTDSETAGIESDDFLLHSVYAKSRKPIVLFNLGNLAYSQGPRTSDGLTYTYSKYHETAGDKTIRIGLSETDTVLVKKIQY